MKMNEEITDEMTEEEQNEIIISMAKRVYDFNGKTIVSVEQQGNTLMFHLEPTDVAFINIYEFLHFCKAYIIEEYYTLIDDGSGDICLYKILENEPVRVFGRVGVSTYKDNILSALKMFLFQLELEKKES